MFRSFGEFLLSVRKAAGARTAAEVDPRLETRAPSGASEAAPGDGGFFVQPEFVPAMVERMYQTGEVLRRCSEIPITKPNSNGIKFAQFSEDSRANGSRLGGLQAYWQNEADSAQSSKPKAMLSEMPLKKLLGVVYCTEELFQDAGALEQFVVRGMGQEMAFTLEAAVIGGTGSGSPLGILNSAALVQVAKETGQPSGTIVANNVVNAVGRLWAASHKSAVWFFNQQLLPQLYSLSIPVGTGGGELKLFEFADGTDDLPWSRLAGFPLIPIEHCPAPGTVGDLILADMSRYMIASREMQSAVSMEVKFLTDELAFRFLWRVDGQPIDRLPVTPKYGTNTTSPFVAIAAR